MAATAPKVKEPISSIPIAPKLNRRFYEALVMLEILGKNRGDHIEEGDMQFSSSQSSSDSECLRRSFLRHLAYLCDYEKSGDRTTAIALQSTPEQVIFWFASNRSSDQDITARFMRSILERLKCIGPEDVDKVESYIFREAVDFSARRISTYVECIRDDVDFVLRELAESRSKEGTVSRSKILNRFLTSFRRKIGHVAAEDSASHVFKNWNLPVVLRLQELRRIYGSSTPGQTRRTMF